MAVHSPFSDSSTENLLDKAQEQLNNNVNSHDEFTNVTKGLMITKKGNLKSTGKFEDLKEFIKERQLSTSNWTSPGGACKLCEDKYLIIRWYTNTESLTLRWERANEVKDRIISFAQSESNWEKSESNRPFQVEEALHNISGITPTGGDEKNQHSNLDENTLEDLRFEMAAFITTTNNNNNNNNLFT